MCWGLLLQVKLRFRFGVGSMHGLDVASLDFDKAEKVRGRYETVDASEKVRVEVKVSFSSTK